MVTALLGYLDLLALFLGEAVLFPCKIQSFFLKFPEFCSLLLPSYFSINFASKIGTALYIHVGWSTSASSFQAISRISVAYYEHLGFAWNVCSYYNYSWEWLMKENKVTLHFRQRIARQNSFANTRSLWASEGGEGACNLRCLPGAITIQIQNSLLSD